MAKENITWAVSTDIAGWWGGPKTVEALYQGKIKAAEVICWAGVWKRYWPDKGNSGVKVAGWHGPVGIVSSQASKEDKLMNGLLIGRDELVKAVTNFGGYGLVHRRHLGGEVDWWRRNYKGLLYVENDSCLAETVELVREYDQGRNLRMGLMVDLFHVYRSLYGRDWFDTNNVNGKLRGMLDYVAKVVDGVKVIGFHVPVGQRKADALPWMEADSGFWKAVANLMDNCPTQVAVLENQGSVANTTGLPLTRRQMRDAVERNLNILGVLQSEGLFV